MVAVLAGAAGVEAVAVRVGPRVGPAAVQAQGLLLHHRGRFAGRGAQLVNNQLGATFPQVPVSTFGVISNTRFATGDSGSSRQLQFAMKLVF